MNSGEEKNHYPSESAGRLIVREVPTALADFKIGEARKLLLSNLRDYVTINYIYVVDKRHHLLGVISIKNLLQLDSQDQIEEQMSSPVVKVHPYTDQERVAYLALKNNLKSVPVVDKEGKFLGIVPSDAILRITFVEAQEDLLKFAGLSKSATDDVMHLSLRTSLTHRLPWLALGLGGGLVMARVITRFENTLEENLILAAFIPLVVYTASAVSSQMQAFFIRDIVMQTDLNFKKYFVRQFKVAGILALIIGLGLWMVVNIFYRQILVANIIGVALAATVVSAMGTGIVFPYVFSKLKLDPANGSGPVGTIVQDLMSLWIYLLIASWLL
jgi:magnesium transporter